MKTTSEETALSYIPSSLSESIKKTMSLYKGNVSEIRLRVDSPVYITVDNKNVSCNIIPTYNEIQWTLRSLCGNSMYSHSETIKEGYICADGGIRAGVCGRAVTQGEKILTIADITSICIRIPHRVRGISNTISNTLINKRCNMLIFSPPGMGKTTMLREISATLSSPPLNCRVAVIDTRFEICGALEGCYSIDALYGYPRHKGMETALRTLSPEFIICDEIGNQEDASAILAASGAGIPVIASIHANNIKDLITKTHIDTLIKRKIFDYVIGLNRSGSNLELTAYNSSGEICTC